MRNAVYVFTTILLISSSAAAARATPHGDHNAKHGGQFFMAPDGYHHLEGVLLDGEFQLHFYDAKTRPVSAERFAGRTEVSIEGLKPDGLPDGNVRRLRVEVGTERTHLAAPLPVGRGKPLYVTVRVRFEENARPELFNFAFED